MIPGQILIVDDNDAVRKGIRTLISHLPGWTVCGEALDGLDAIDKVKELRPQVVLMDISMPRMNGLQATRILRKEMPETTIIIVSQNDPDVVKHQVREVDAAGYVAKSELSKKLLPVLKKLAVSLTDGETVVPAAPEPTWLNGGGSLGRLIREFDWSKTSLGPMDNWPQSLKTAVSLILSSQHPMWVGWGPEMTFLYNDAYIQVLSKAKHPAALGKPAAEVWAEIWDICGPLADKVYQNAEASFVDDVRLFMNRGNFLEETYYSFSYSPIRDESGKVAGLFCPSTEVSPKVINARRLRTLSELSAGALTQKTTEAACASVFTTLAKNPDDLPFAMLYLTDAEGKKLRLEQARGLPANVPSLTPGTVDLIEPDADPNATIWPLAEVLKTAHLQVVDVGGISALPLGPAQQRICDAVVLPVTSRGLDKPLGVLIAGVNPTRRLDTEYRTFYDLIAGQIATAIQNVRASEEERKRLEALAEIDRAKTAFFSNVSHEFRTPLTLMLGPVEDLLAKSYTGLSPAAKSQLELVSRNGTRLLRLVNTLLDFSRIEAGRMQAVYQPTDLSAFTVELASVFRSATEKAGLALELHCPTLAQPVFVDRNMWEKIVLNLISNAFKFTFEGKIAISLSEAGDHVELRVQDTGVGISQQELPRLFDRFHRIENTRSRTHEGSGIGLALVLELVKLHGGWVRAESTPGAGSTFIVGIPMGSAHLPADRIGKSRSPATTAVGAAPFVEEALRWLPEADQTIEPEIFPGDELIPVPCPANSTGDGSEKRPRVLVADDNADMRQYVVRLLSERYEVQAVPDGQAALKAVQQNLPDLVLSDVMMPNLDGFGLLQELREDPQTRTVPIILLSARAGEESRVEGMEKGADDYLIKPFSARELLARVQTHLDMARIRKQGEEALRQRTAQFETLLNAAPLGIYVVDADFRLREMNPTAMARIGSAKDAIGQSFEKFVLRRWPKQQADEILHRFRHTLETGEPYSVAEWNEQPLNGEPRMINEWRIDRIPLPDGRHGVVCYFRDISHLVKARQTIIESELRLRIAQRAARSGTWEANLVTRQLFWSPELKELWGFPQDSVLDDPRACFRSAIHPEDLANIDKTLAALLENHSSEFRVEYRVKRSDGTLRWIESIAQIFYDAGGHAERLIGVSADITERKQIEQNERKLAAEAVAANAKFRAVFEQTPVFAAIMTNDGIILDANRLSLETWAIVPKMCWAGLSGKHLTGGNPRTPGIRFARQLPRLHKGLLSAKY